MNRKKLLFSVDCHAFYYCIYMYMNHSVFTFLVNQTEGASQPMHPERDKDAYITSNQNAGQKHFLAAKLCNTVLSLKIWQSRFCDLNTHNKILE